MPPSLLTFSLDLEGEEIGEKPKTAAETAEQELPLYGMTVPDANASPNEASQPF